MCVGKASTLKQTQTCNCCRKDILCYDFSAVYELFEQTSYINSFCILHLALDICLFWCFQFEKNPLRWLCRNNKNLNRLIVNLFPSDNGYSLMLKTASNQYAETLQLPYDECELLQYIDNEQVGFCAVLS